MSIGKLDFTQAQHLTSLKEHFLKLISNNPRNGENMKEKKPILYAVKIQETSYAADTENLEKINEKFFEKSSGNLIEVYLPFMIRAVEAARAFSADGYMNEISDFMYRQLSELHKELSNTLPLVTEDKELSLLIFQGAANGLMNFMRGSKQSRMDWFTTQDILPKCGTSGE